MLKKIVASLLLSGFSAIALAQSSGAPKNSNVPTAEENPQNWQQKKEDVFCFYDDKRYSEGALKEVGKFTLICKNQSPLSTSYNRQPGWEPMPAKRLEMLMDGTQKK